MQKWKMSGGPEKSCCYGNKQQNKQMKQKERYVYRYLFKQGINMNENYVFDQTDMLLY